MALPKKLPNWERIQKWRGLLTGCEQDIYAYLLVYIYVYTHKRMYCVLYRQLYRYIYIYICILYIYIYIFLYVYIYIYLSICKIYIYIYIDTLHIINVRSPRKGVMHVLLPYEKGQSTCGVGVCWSSVGALSRVLSTGEESRITIQWINLGKL